MKRWSYSCALAIGLVLGTGRVQAGMMHGAFGGSHQQFSTFSHGTTGSFGGSWTGGHAFGTWHAAAFHGGATGGHFAGGQSWSGNRGGFGYGGRYGYRGGFYHGGFYHGRSGFVSVYVDGFPYWYPAYWDYPYYSYYPYYYDYPPPAVYDNGYYPTYSTYVSPPDTGSGGTTAPEPSTSQAAPTYNELGAAWGQDLRRDIVTWDQFVAYMKAYIVTAIPASQADFHAGFIRGYGINAVAAYDKAATKATATTPQTPKTINVQPEPKS